MIGIFFLQRKSKTLKARRDMMIFQIWECQGFANFERFTTNKAGYAFIKYQTKNQALATIEALKGKYKIEPVAASRRQPPEMQILVSQTHPTTCPGPRRRPKFSPSKGSSICCFEKKELASLVALTDQVSFFQYDSLLAIAEETLAEFLSKATGTAVDWVQMVEMKPGPDSIGIIAVSHNCSGVAAQPDQGLVPELQGYVVYLVRVRRGGRKRPLPKYIIYGKPKHHGITQLKF
ncbi:Homeobox-leucine zipper protein REVOLUTA [Zea mays]|uniref:Ribosomal protein L15 n=1 Tax=Zea mays TaxID=4577 RepID=A0A1D6IXK0_MAIZE|nr:Homeobox-leucine zipper protein REVOLUTA [Zea mays]